VQRNDSLPASALGHYTSQAKACLPSRMARHTEVKEIQLPCEHIQEPAGAASLLSGIMRDSQPSSPARRELHPSVPDPI